ncbi:MAG: hypothetical protein BWX47_01270 [candidate division Hyd24-12 bacterium ADurb.Bin004]|nr:MAG: hypothetical protein BWX47_01270 [candidate division Hyd24-12 bacterium ADurb.Bin004]
MNGLHHSLMVSLNRGCERKPGRYVRDLKPLGCTPEHSNPIAGRRSHRDARDALRPLSKKASTAGRRRRKRPITKPACVFTHSICSGANMARDLRSDGFPARMKR